MSPGIDRRMNPATIHRNRVTEAGKWRMIPSYYAGPSAPFLL